MKYRDLVSIDTMIRLTQVSFSTPAKNLAMYRLYAALQPHQGYLENERVKLIHKHGEDLGKGWAVTKPEALRRFHVEFDNILETEIPDKIKCPDITEDDFLDENCSYPIDKSMWPSAKDISAFLNFCKALEIEKN